VRLGVAALERPAVAVALVALLLLGTAGALGLLEPTETRYAEIAREMHASGDYLVPRLDGIPHFHKPPLAYWATAAGFAALGQNEWGARLPATLAAILTLLLTVSIARRRFAPTVAPAAAVWTLGGSALFFALGRSVATDPYLMLAVAAFWAWAPSPWALAALGVGFFAKGPVVFIPTVLAVLVAALAGRDRAALKLLGPAWGWWITAVVALPWYLLVVARTPGLIEYLFGNQIWQRYTTTVHHRGGPPWYFLAVLIAGAIPWTPALIAGLGRLWRERAHEESRLLLAWLLVPLVFFSFSGSKLPSYLLPCAPAIALIAARGVAPAGRATRWAGATLLAGIAVAGWGIGPRALGTALGVHPPTAARLPLSAHVALACLLYAATWLARGRTAGGGLLVVFGWTSLLLTAAAYEGVVGSPRPLVHVLAENRAPGEPVVECGRFNAGVPFYLREPVRLHDVEREIEFDDPARHPALFVSRDSIAALASRGRVWVLGPGATLQTLADSLHLPLTRTAEWRRDVLGVLAR
jgi:4-amino-4-deoxy-L-arabinose transferase